MTPLRGALPLVLALLPAAATGAELDATLCPILADVAGPGGIPEAVQAQLVVKVAGAYDYDHDALMRVPEEADAATSAACPEARNAVLAATGKPSLADAMR